MGDFMFERWRKPIKILSIENDPANIIELSPGRFVHDVHVITDEEGMERLRKGYACLQCGEGQPEAFPVKCWVCPFEIRAFQALWLERLYTGVEDMRATPSIDAEENRMQEENERRRSVKNKNSRIWLPGD